MPTQRCLHHRWKREIPLTQTRVSQAAFLWFTWCWNLFRHQGVLVHKEGSWDAGLFCVAQKRSFCYTVHWHLPRGQDHAVQLLQGITVTPPQSGCPQGHVLLPQNTTLEAAFFPVRGQIFQEYLSDGKYLSLRVSFQI